MKRKIRTQCPYCGVGCGLVATTDNGRLESVEGDPLHPTNRGATCRKPLALPESVHARDRATRILRRPTLDDRWEPATWRETVPDLARRLRDVTERHGPDAIAFYISGQLLTEDYYAAVKLAKGALGTNNVDSNSRLCMSSAVAGYVGALGSDGPPPAYADIDLTDHVFLLGSNAAACHPIVWSRIRRRQAEGATVTVVDPRRTDTADAADLHLPVRPGTDLPLLCAMLHVLAGEERIDRAFVERHTEGIEQALATAAEWPPDRAAEVCGVPAEAIVDAARRFGSARRAMVLWSMGANQSTVGTLKNRALLNLCLATGNIGRPGTGPLSLTGQPNAMGGRETGGLAHLLPGYRLVTRAEDRAEIRRLWELPPSAPGPSPEPGIASTELVDALEDGRVKVVWIVATNPVVSQPDAERFAEALRRAELVIVQDAFQPTETSALAHVVLPAAAWPEKEGTMTSSERRVGLVRKALDAPGDALPDWEIFARVGRALGFADAFGWRSAADVFAEYATTTAGRPPDISGLSHERLRREGPLQWPVPARGADGDEHPGTERLYRSGRFPTESGRARLAATPHAEPADAPDAEHPLVLTTGRIASQWHTMTRTGKSASLVAAEPEPFVELHADDAAAAGIVDRELVRVRSRRGMATLRARVSDAVPAGTAFAPFHWGALHLDPGAGAVNGLLGLAIDPTSKQAELKACAVRVEPLRTAARAPSVRPRARRRLLVVGAGMAAQATVEAALAHAGSEAFDVVMVGREPEAPYNRVLLSQVLAGSVGEREARLRHPDWFADRGIDLRTQTTVTGLDLRAREATLGTGERLVWDRLVLATGSVAAIPPIPGADRRGVHVLRTMGDARAILADAAAGRHGVVIGGGLLGLEAARALQERGLSVTVVHLADRLMEQQLDPLAAGLLERAVRRLGIDVRRSAATEAIAGSQRVDSVVLGDGEEIAADVVVVACGVRPDVELAREAGLEVGRGVLVDDELRASAPGVWAVGECAEHRGTVYGLWAPLLEQSRAAGASIAGEPAGFAGAVPATTLKVAGIDLFCAGEAEASSGDEEVLALDSRRGRYRRLIVRDGRLAGALLLGDLGDARRLRELLGSGDLVPDALLDHGPGAAEEADDSGLLCSCQVVSTAEAERIIRDRGLRTIEQVAEHTAASTGCGGCRPQVGALLARIAADEREPLSAGSPGR